jgi:hypothetical protein
MLMFFPTLSSIFPTRFCSKKSPTRQEAGGVARATKILLEVASATKLPTLLTSQAGPVIQLAAKMGQLGQTLGVAPTKMGGFRMFN